MQKITNNEPLKYSNVVIIGDLDGSNLVIPQIEIENSKITGKVNFDYATLKDSVSFAATRFLGNVSFIDTNFSKEPNFQKSVFEESAFFDRASFPKGANFNLAIFNNSANFLRANFIGPARFQQTRFAETVSFMDTQFNGESYFEEAKFGAIALFMNAQFNAISSFRGAHFKNNTDFRYVKFIEPSDFYGAEFGGQTNFVGAKFELLNINWETLKDRLVPNGPVFLAFIRNFRNNEQFEDADDCYYQYREWRMINRPVGLAKIFDYFAWISCGFGVRWYQPILASALLLSLFSFYYISVDIFGMMSKILIKNSPNINLSDIKKKFIKAVAFSTVTLLSLPSDWYPFEKEEHTQFLKRHFYSALIERLTGWALFLLLVGTLTRLMVRY
ncbi:MAG: pentapeptide repeat-containing protein [Methanotrichaceae archaeon]|nr:pentapeptide repeat-containing protein [Methanotrichaceae archaeon]